MIYTAPLIKVRLIASALFFSFLFLLFSLALVTPAHAADCVATQPAKQTDYYKNVIDDFNRCAIKSGGYDTRHFTWNQTINIADSLGSLITGVSLNHPETNPITQSSGALAAVSGAIAMVYSTPPASGVEYFAHQFQRLNPNQDAYAAGPGLGFQALDPVAKIWSVFRNIAYLGFVLIFVVIGFMIMFRHKISAQAVATVQDSLPRIVVALILVTFSYAIAGLKIDLMYVLINLVVAILAQTNLIVTNAGDIYFNHNIFGLVLGGWGQLARDTSAVVQSNLNAILKSAVDTTSCRIDKDLLIHAGAAECPGKLIIWILGWLGGIIFGVALIFMTIRIFFMLLIAYVSIIMLTIFAPFIFLFNSLPGNNGAKEWFKQMGANISVFPVVVIMFLLAAILSGIPDLGATSKQSVVGGGTTFDAPLLTSGFNGAILGQLVGFGIILMIPSAAKLVKERFGVKEGAVGGALGAGLGVLGAGAQPFQKAGGGIAAPYKQAYSYERFQKAQAAFGYKTGGAAHVGREPGVPEQAR